MNTDTNTYKHIFGPVKSRRLGISLGIDIMPHKTCSFNCIYCECGKTTLLTQKRKNYTPLETIFSEIKSYLSQKPKLDYITFSGSGEPTLHKSIKQIVDYIKNNYPQYKVALLTNSSIFSVDYKLIEEVARVDLIMASLDAASQETFEKINKPHNSIAVEDIIRSLVVLKKEFKNSFWLEVFFAKGVNDSKEDIETLKKAINLINPDKIVLNTLDRPPAEKFVEPLKEERLKEIQVILGKKAFNINKSDKIITSGNDKKNILETIKRRPSRVIDIAEAFGLTQEEAEKQLTKLEKDGVLEKIKLDRGVFYKLK